MKALIEIGRFGIVQCITDLRHVYLRSMDQATHNKIVSFIWGIADDVLRDLFRRGKYPDVILPMCVIRRMDSVLEPTKANVLETKKGKLQRRDSSSGYQDAKAGTMNMCFNSSLLSRATRRAVA